MKVAITDAIDKYKYPPPQVGSLLLVFHCYMLLVVCACSLRRHYSNYTFAKKKFSFRI